MSRRVEALGDGQPRGSAELQVSDVTTDSAVAGAKPLRCPYCGDEFTADLQYVGGSYSEHRDLHGYECDNFRCNARWDKFGNPTRAPGERL